MKRQFAQFLIRWGLNTVGLFVAAHFLKGLSYQEEWRVLVVAALVLSIINALIKPFVVILSLPALLVTLGIFSIVINGFMVYLAHLLYSPFQVSSFGTAILAGLVVGLVNYTVTRLFDIAAKEEV
ncbi:MAG: phage holin family protein [Candidatus Saccharimonadales bacterium]|mgnify:CR=1 FL=1